MCLQFRVSKHFILKRVKSQFFVDFFVSQYRRTLQGHPFVMCLGNFQVAKKFTDEKGGVSKLSVEKFLCQSAEKFRRGTP